MEFVYSWFKQIFMFSILASLLVNIMPDEKYAKYMRFITRLLIIIIVLTPLLKIFGQKNSIANSLDFFMDYDMPYQSDEGDAIEGMQRVVSSEVCKEVQRIGQNHGVLVDDVMTYMCTDSESADYGTILLIEVQVKQHGNMEAMQKDIAGYFGMEMEDVKIKY